jgi:hypothetical protein
VSETTIIRIVFSPGGADEERGTSCCCCCGGGGCCALSLLLLLIESFLFLFSTFGSRLIDTALVILFFFFLNNNHHQRMFSRLLRSSSSYAIARRFYSIEESSMHVKRAAKPPIFEDVVPTRPKTSLRRRRDSNNTVSTLSSLDKAMPNLPLVVSLEPTQFSHQVTTLSNGVRVISQQSVDTGAVVGIALDAGTRHERVAERGSTLLAERLAFKVQRYHDSIFLVTSLIFSYFLILFLSFSLLDSESSSCRSTTARIGLHFFAILHSRCYFMDG